MRNKYFQPGAQRAEKVSDLFATIAPRYDLINDLQSFGLHRAWKNRLVRLAAPCAGDRALDLCCGTGDVCFAMAQYGAEVVGLDFSEPMLEVARGKAKGQSPKSKGAVLPCSLNPVRFVHGDAQRIPFANNEFDIVTVGYGLRNLGSWEAGLQEMERVAKPGGRLLVLDFGKPANALWRGIYFSYLRWILPVFGKTFCHDSQTYGYIFESLRDYPAQRGVAEKMQQLKCEGVAVVNLLRGVMSINYGRKGR